MTEPKSLPNAQPPTTLPQHETPATEQAAFAPQQPKSLTDLFVSFMWLALQGFGGVIAVAQRELVERKRWLSKEQFLEELAVAQILPGPNVINLSLMIGSRYFGLRGALAALAGMLLVPLLIVLLLAVLYSQYGHLPSVAGALKGIAAVAAGLILAATLKLLSTLRHHPLGKLLCAFIILSGFIAITVLHIPLAQVLLVLGLASIALVWRKS